MQNRNVSGELYDENIILNMIAGMLHVRKTENIKNTLPSSTQSINTVWNVVNFLSCKVVLSEVSKII